MRLQDKLAIVTGGASGIGLAAAKRFTDEGARVAVADINRDAAEAAAAQIGNGAVAMSFDVSSSRAVTDAVHSLKEQLGGLDILVNNAGIEVLGSVSDTPEDEWDRTLDVNLKGAFLMSKACWPLLAERKGAIVNTASTAAISAFPGDVAYSVSKAGIAMLTRTTALEGAPVGIRANCVCPGPTDTPLMRSFIEDDPDWDVSHTASLIPLGRMAEPQDIANAMLFLVSDEASYITGVVLPIDGGITSGHWFGSPEPESN